MHVRPLALTALLALVVACSGEPASPPPQPVPRIDVFVEPAIAAPEALRVGKNASSPRDGYQRLVSAQRGSDGSLVIQVNTRHREYSFHSRIRLGGPPGALAAEATAHPGTPCRGTVQVNHDHIGDLTDAPPLVRSELTNWRSGSDVTETLAIEITEADLP